MAGGNIALGGAACGAAALVGAATLAGAAAAGAAAGVTGECGAAVVPCIATDATTTGVAATPVANAAGVAAGEAPLTGAGTGSGAVGMACGAGAAVTTRVELPWLAAKALGEVTALPAEAVSAAFGKLEDRVATEASVVARRAGAGG
jgi:pilus assembly protein FimV